VSEGTYFRRKKRYGGVGVTELRELWQLRDENRKLKGLVADLTLDKAMLQEALRRKW
jgi:putative transposase